MTFNVLIACHCKYEYRTKNPVVREWRRCKDRMGLLHTCQHKPIQWESTEPINEMKWLDPDPSCPQHPLQYRSWSDVPTNHYDIVWSMYCSVYEYLTSETRLTEYRDSYGIFYHDVWNALKPGGIFVVVVDTIFGIPLDEQEERAKIFIQSLEDPWKVELVPTSDLPFLVSNMAGEKHALVFTKQQTGGRTSRRTDSRKKQKSRRRRRQ